MGRQLVLLLWFASALFASCATAQEKGGANRLLTDADLGDEKLVADWFPTNATAADRKDSQRYFDLGIEAKRKRNWSAATKAFGESAIRYPDPWTLLEYADTELRMLGEVRARDRNLAANSAADLQRTLTLLKSALAAETVINSMRAGDKERLRVNIDCVAAYLRSGKAPAKCELLQAYGIKN